MSEESRKGKAAAVIASWEDDGWRYEGDLAEALDMQSDRVDTSLDFENYEYMSVSISLKRRRKK